LARNVTRWKVMAAYHRVYN